MDSEKKQYHKRYLIPLVLLACIGSFYFGYQAGVLAVFAGDFSPMNIHTKSAESSLLVSIMPLTAAFGALLSGPLSKRGRRKALLFTDLLGIAGPIIEALSGFVLFLVGRAICGVAVGLNSSLVPLFINEISPEKLKGPLGTLNQVFICIGVILGYAVGMGPFQGNNYWWRIMMLIPAGLSLFRILMFMLIFKLDTPLFYVTKERIDKAAYALDKIYVDDIQIHLEKIMADVRKHSESGSITYRELLSPKYRSRFLVGNGLSILQQLSGINAICYSATTVLGGSQIASCMVGVCQMIAGLVSAVLIGYAGRRPILLFGSLFCGLFLFLFAWTLLAGIKVMQMVFLFSYLFTFGLTLGPVVWLYIPEILPDIAVSITTMTNWLFTAAVVQTFQITVKFGLVPNFVAFGVFCMIGTIFVKKGVTETKKKEEIKQEQNFAVAAKTSEPVAHANAISVNSSEVTAEATGEI